MKFYCLLYSKGRISHNGVRHVLIKFFALKIKRQYSLLKSDVFLLKNDELLIRNPNYNTAARAKCWHAVLEIRNNFEIENSIKDHTTFHKRKCVINTLMQ